LGRTADLEKQVCATSLCACYEKVEYLHLNPVRAGLVRRAEDWPWSSARDYTGSVSRAVSPHRVLAIDRILLPADERTRI
jgi:hypothetical protein